MRTSQPGQAAHRAWIAVFLLIVPGAARAAAILDAAYDPIRDELVVEIAYRGTSPGHDFSLSWGPCRESGSGTLSTVARLIDAQGGESARQDFRVRERFSLQDAQCRPAHVTLRLGRVSNATVSVSAAAQAPSAPGTRIR